MDHFKNNGFSLLEILLVIILGIILLLGLVQVYLSMKSSHRQQESMARLQENARAASAILAKGIYTAGYFGCASKSVQEGIRGYSSSNLPDFLRDKNIAENTDVIVIQKADSNITYLTRNVLPPTNFIAVKDNPTTINNLWLSISDCVTSNTFKVENYVGKTIYVNQPINHAYKRLDTEVAAFTEIAYFLSEGSSKYKKSQSVYSLYSLVNGSKNPSAHKQALVSGIKDMKVSYGLDNDGDGVVDVYYPADQVVSWNKVRSVAITLQLEDGKVQKEWQIYVALRERIS